MKFPYILRKDQLEALSQLCSNDHLIYVSPTGSGKSVVFQKFIFDRPGIRALFISPLNALTRQQVDRFSDLGIPTFSEDDPVTESGVWMMSPETVQGKTVERIAKWQPDFMVVDEAHCVWEWGRGFRPDYQKVFDLVELVSVKKTLWCSATLPVSFRDDLKRRLIQMKPGSIAEVGRFEFSKNISLSLEQIPVQKKLIWLMNRLRFHVHDSGVIFCNTRAGAEALAKATRRVWGGVFLLSCRIVSRRKACA